MKLARYHGGGVVRIEDEPAPVCPEGGLLVRTEACGLCSGELMDWYMDRKVPHVFGHEVVGRVVESKDDRIPVGSRVFPHHHAPCLTCELCRRGAYVHCPQWKATKLQPGGMAEFFAVGSGNLNDTLLVDDLAASEAALIEPLACVAKSLRKAAVRPQDRVAVIGLGVMGLMHMLALRGMGITAVGFELNEDRFRWARNLGLEVAVEGLFDVVVVCPGSEAALERAYKMAAPEAKIVLFAPMPPGAPTPVPLNELYFRDLSLINVYSCGPDDTAQAAEWLRAGWVRAQQVVSDFIELDRLPQAYLSMKSGAILKPMVIFADA